MLKFWINLCILLDEILQYLQHSFFKISYQIHAVLRKKLKQIFFKVSLEIVEHFMNCFFEKKTLALLLKNNSNILDYYYKILLHYLINACRLSAEILIELLHSEEIIVEFLEDRLQYFWITFVDLLAILCRLFEETLVEFQGILLHNFCNISWMILAKFLKKFL